MEKTDDVKKREIATTILRTATIDQKQKLIEWLDRLLEIRDEKTSSSQKLRAAIDATYNSQAIWQLIKLLAREMKKHGWDQRSPKAKWAAAGAAVGLTAFGGQGAGIAALGSAIGVPLWVIFGSGAAVAKILIDELKATAPQTTNRRAKQDEPELKGDLIEGTAVDLQHS